MRHVRLLAAFFILATAVESPAAAQSSIGSDEPIAALLRRFEQTVQSGDRQTLTGLFGSAVVADQLQRFASQLLAPDIVRATVRERDRTQLEGAPAGEGHRLVVDLFVETAGRARILTATLDVRRPPDGGADSWRFVNIEGLTSVEGLYRLRVNPDAQFLARQLTVTSEDLVLTLSEGSVFEVVGESGVTGLVLLGRGEMRFSPAPETEQGQLRLFANAPVLSAPFDSAFVRINPGDYTNQVSRSALVPAPTVDPRMLRRAQDVFEREGPKSLSLDLNDLSQDTWYLLPPGGDFVAEVETRRFGWLTYARSGIQAEDIQLFSRSRRRTISLYASKDKLEARGRFYTEDSLLEFDVLDYNIEAAIDPVTEFVQGRARLSLRIRDTATSTLTIRLAETLNVSSIVSLEFGRLLHLRVRNQNTIIISLPTTLVRDADVTLVLTYSGRVPAQAVDREGLQLTLGQDDLPVTLEPSYLLSNRAYWYPQNPVSDYATATLRLTVPRGYSCVASGQDVTPAGGEVTLRDLAIMPNGRTFVFRATEPLRYLAFVVSRFNRVARSTVQVVAPDPLPRLDRQRDTVTLTVDANPTQMGRGREILGSVEDIMRFYATLLGDAPYASATVALVESELPGGHSPGYFAVVNAPVGTSPAIWRNDPAAFDGFPDFFVAHELAHQWWGQAVGWKNYHEQWISEGFAQYFAALYAQKTRGDQTFADMLRQFRRWGISESDQGPVHLGYRLGHLTGESRVFRALVYNKGAAVLHMLRRLVGDDIFFSALRRFYDEQKFRKAGTDDLRRVFEEASGRPLDRFFDRWIYESDIPTVRYSTLVEGNQVTVRFDQPAAHVFDLPVTVTIAYANGRFEDVVIPLTDAHVERRLTVTGPVRQVHVNRDNAALATFEGR